MSCQGKVQAAVRARHGQAGNRDYNGDWHCLFDQESVIGGTFNGRLLAWINTELSSAYTSVNGAQAAYAASQSAYNWNSMETIDPIP